MKKRRSEGGKREQKEGEKGEGRVIFKQGKCDEKRESGKSKWIETWGEKREGFVKKPPP